MDELTASVLEDIGKADRGSDQIGFFRAYSDTQKEFQGFESNLQDAIELLIENDYIRKVEPVKDPSGEYSIEYLAYRLTPMGRRYLITSSAGYTSISGLNNSNLSLNSPGSRQKLKIGQIDKETKELLEQLKLALEKGDKKNGKKIINLLADKSFDVISSIIINRMLS